MSNHVDTTHQPPQVLSLCSGMCGLERGIERAIGQLHVVAYVEIEAFIIQNLAALMEAGVLAPTPIWPNLKTFPSTAFHRKLHGIVGGYPCQPFSVAGSQRGNKDPRHLWPHIQRIIEATNPVWCFFENVEGHLQLGYDEVYRSLRAMGYTVESDLFTAAEVGAPHKRTRLFILAVADSYINASQKREIFPWLRSEPKRTSSTELGYTQHHGHTTFEKLRSHETPSEKRGQKKQDLARQPSGTDRPTNDTGLQRCKGGSELANAKNERESSRNGKRSQNGRNEQQLEGAKKGSNAKYGSKPKLANPNHGRCKEQRTTGIFTSQNDNNGSFKIGCYPEPVEGWPLGPGPYQHPWEAPRTIESGLGSTAHGYNFREDLLRMYGNGVVEQTAHLAWVTLWNKFQTAN